MSQKRDLLTVSGCDGHTDRVTIWWVVNAKYYPEISSYLSTLITGLKTLPPKATGSTSIVGLINFSSKLGLLFLEPKKWKIAVVFKFCRSVKKQGLQKMHRGEFFQMQLTWLKGKERIFFKDGDGGLKNSTDVKKLNLKPAEVKVWFL